MFKNLYISSQIFDIVKKNKQAFFNIKYFNFLKIQYSFIQQIFMEGLVQVTDYSTNPGNSSKQGRRKISAPMDVMKGRDKQMNR